MEKTEHGGTALEPRCGCGKPVVPTTQIKNSQSLSDSHFAPGMFKAKDLPAGDNFGAKDLSEWIFLVKFADTINKLSLWLNCLNEKYMTGFPNGKKATVVMLCS